MNETSNLLDNGETVSQEETESEQEEHDDVRELERQQVDAGFGFFHVVLLVVSGLATAADAVEIFGVSFVVPIADSDLHLDSGRKGWLDAIIFLGMMIGGYLWGGLADVIGRRPCLISAMLLNGVCGLASAFSVDFYMFLVLRLASGIGVGGSQPVVFSFVSEFFTEKQRGPMVILLASCWQPGIIFTALLAWVMLGIPQTESAISFYIGSLHIVNWRVFLMICTVPSFVSAASFLILPESPGFLYHAKRFDDVKKVLNRVRRLNSWCPCMWWKPTIPNQEDIRSLMGDESVELQVSREHGPSGETTDGVVDTEGAVEGASPLLVKTRIYSCFTSVSTKANKIIDASLGLFRWKYLRATLLLLIIWFTQSYGLVAVGEQCSR